MGLLPGERIALSALAGAMRERGFGLVLLFLTLPNLGLIPGLPLLPLICGIPAILICVQMVTGRQTPRLPGAVGRLSVSRRQAGRLIAIATWFARLARPRLPWMVSGIGLRVLGAVGIVLTAVLCLPLPGLNIIPGVGVFILSVGLLEADGAIAITGCVIGFLGCLFAYVMTVSLVGLLAAAGTIPP